MSTMFRRGYSFLTALVMLRIATGYIWHSGTEPDCADIQCSNKGTLDVNTCTCICDGDYTGPFCETELMNTTWPEGRYSLLSTVFGCPEPDYYGWHRGYINLTIPASKPAQRWKMNPEVDLIVQNTADPHILGPYHLHALQLNFCTRLDRETDRDGNQTDSENGSNVWSKGNYCLIKAGDSCMKGFTESSVTLAGYLMTWSDTDGILPNITVDNNSSTLTLYYCCRHEQEESTAMDLPHEFPFILPKKNGSSCTPVSHMKVEEEKFDLVDDLHLFQFEGHDSMLTEDGDYQRLGLCYYSPTARRECYYPVDQGSSYIGTMNVSMWGEPCLNWYDVSDQWRRSKNYVGDDFTQNHCRRANFYTSRPWCYVTYPDGPVSEYCNPAICDLDETLEEIGTFKPVYAVDHLDERQPENAVDGCNVGFPFQSQRPKVKPWIQVDLEEAFMVHAVKIKRRYLWFPVNFRFVGIHVSQRRWDFINYGALQCEGRRNPRMSKVFLFMCHRPIQGQYVTIRNFDDSNPDRPYGTFHFLEISEITVLVKRAACTRRLGLLSGEVRDFQLSGSGDNADSMFERGRLLLPGSGWCMDTLDDPYFIVDLIVPTVVSGLELQGWMDGQTSINIEAFTLEYGVKENMLQTYLDPTGQIKEYHWLQNVKSQIRHRPLGSFSSRSALFATTHIDNYSGEMVNRAPDNLFRIDTSLPPAMIKRIMLLKTLVLRYFKINIIEYSGHPCLKLELLGCPKRASRDLSCGPNTTFYGYDTLVRVNFWMPPDKERTANQSECVNICNSITDCISLGHSVDECRIFKSTRYNPHYLHWLVPRLNEYDITMTKLCIKDVKDARICGGEITEPTEIESPSYPFYYGQQMQCTWKIRFSKSSFIRIQIKDINLAREDSLAQLQQNGVFDISTGQCVDALTIDDLTLTSSNESLYKGAIIVSRTASAIITLKSCARYSMAEAKGFLLDISYSDYPECRSSNVECFTSCRQTAATISSPAYPAGLRQGTPCQWHIQGELGQYVMLSFKVIDIRGSTRSCQTSFVNVVDEDLYGVKRQIGSYCSYNFPINTVKSSWQFMDIHLTVGSDAEGGGFTAEYTLVDYVQPADNSSTVEEEGCDDWQGYESHCYQMFETELGLTWLSAESYCQANGGHLVSLASQGEANFIHSMLTRQLFNTTVVDPTSYIGLRKLGNGERYDNYQWSDGSPLTYTAWFRNDTSGQSQPDGLESERCTQLSMFSIHSVKNWHDVACAYDKTRMYVCERLKTGHIAENRSIEFVNDDLFRNPSELNNTDFYSCASGEMILRIYACDGHSDCMDGSDEVKCEAGCVDGFVCDSGQCVMGAAFCDFRADCDDGSDENACVLAECLQLEWRCSSGQCISMEHRCDVKEDCFDGSDEKYCVACQESSFQCYDERCVARSRVCDTYNDCSGRFNEDESQGCTLPSQESCAEWYAIGRRENDSYLIHLGTEGAFEVECRFILDENFTILVQTILHHEYEASITWKTHMEELGVTYAGNEEQLGILKNRSSCKQFLSVECSYNQWGFSWYGNRRIEMSGSMTFPNCGCSYVGRCDDNIRSCNCTRGPTEAWFGYGHDSFLKDSGYIQSELLPVRYMHLSNELGSSFSPEWRSTLGPFICEEELIGSGISNTMVCDNNKLADKQDRCILDFDKFGETKGCRDLSHLETCGNESCPAYHARCQDGHCVPFYLLCDGVKHCSTGEDENNCDTNLACFGGLRCRNTSICVPMTNVCDDVIHCPLGDDERFCSVACIAGCTCSAETIMCPIEMYMMAFQDLSLPKLRLKRVVHLVNNNNFDFEMNASAFIHFPYLIYLNMTELRIKHLKPYQFQKNKNLISLDISNNLISVLHSNTFEGLGKLKVLLLMGNPLNEIKPFSFKGLGHLSFLDLSGFSINDVRQGMFHGLSKLERLNMSSSQLVTVESNAFSDLQQLETLDVRFNELKNFDEYIFNGLKELKYLFTSAFTLCCLRPESVLEENCLPSKDEFSSCDDLMRNQVLRAFLWIIGGLALTGNIAVLIYRFIVDRQGLGKSYGVFVTNLGVADFLMGVYLVILAIADTVFRGSYVWNDHHWRNGVACKIAGVLSTLGSEGSVIFLCLITIDRFLVVKFPFGNVRISRKACIVICCCAWMFLLALALVPLSTGDYFQGSFYSRSAVCLALPLTRDRPAGWEYSTGVFIVFNLLAFIGIALAQIIIYREIYVSRGKLVSKGRRHDMTIARNLFLVAITDFLCWFPVGVMGVMALSGEVISGEVYAWIAVFVLPINSALNPFLYTIGASLNRARSIRKSKRKRSSTKGSDITQVFANKSFHFGRRSVSGKETLVDITLRRAVTIQETLTVAVHLAKSIHTLHGVDLIHGKLAPENVYMKDSRKGISRVAMMITPQLCVKEEDLANDMKAYGDILKLMLRSNNSKCR